MEEGDVQALETIFAQVEDPRVERTKRHRLRDIIILAICGVICGAEGWAEIEEFGKAKEAWFTELLISVSMTSGTILPTVLLRRQVDFDCCLRKLLWLEEPSVARSRRDPEHDLTRRPQIRFDRSFGLTHQKESVLPQKLIIYTVAFV